MGQNRPILFLGLAIGIALITTIMVYQWLQSQRSAETAVPEVEVEGMSVAVASNDIPWGTPLAVETVRMVSYPEEALPAGYFKDAEALKGRVVLTNLRKNEPILESKLAPTDITIGGVVAVMDPSKRAMAVKVNEIVGLPGFVHPGDRVDVMVTFENPHAQGQEAGKQITKTVLENTLVLAAGTQMARPEGEEKLSPVSVITLEVTLEEAEKLAMAENGGKLRLALRSPLNPDVQKTTGATFNDLKASFHVAPPRPKRVYRKTDQVEVIKGMDRKTLKF